MLKENPAQQKAIHAVNGAVEIIACPGSGKTTTLLGRIAYMTELGIPGDQILMVTFSRSAATEMEERFIRQNGDAGGVTFRTLHSLCFKILIDSGKYAASDLLTEDEARNFILDELKLKFGFPDAWDMVNGILDEISKVKNNGADMETYRAESCAPQVFRQLFQDYEAMLSQYHKLDFDSMLITAKRLFLEEPQVLERYRRRYRYIQCDEYQDVNPVQRDLLYLLAGKDGNLCVVGDDDQSIYGFRGAEPGIMLSFRHDFPGCQLIEMGTNYRSGKHIVDVAGTLIAENKKRFKKEFVSDRGENEGFKGKFVYKQTSGREAEMDYIVAKIKELGSEGIPYEEMAVLVRTNHQAEKPILRLAREGLPFRTTERIESVYSKWVFKLLQSYLRLSMGDGTEYDLRAMLMKPCKYLKLSAFEGCAYEQGEMVRRLSYIKTGWQREKAVENIRSIFRYFGPGMITMDSSPSSILDSFEKIGILKEIENQAKNRNIPPEEEMVYYQELKDDAARFSTLGEWLDYARQAVLNTQNINKTGRSGSGVNVVTAHQSKGLEWKAVFVIDVNVGIYPHRKSCDTEEEIEEERRLLYVAMTRARDRLEVVSSDTPSPFMAALISRMAAMKKKKMKEHRPPVGTMVLHNRFGVGSVESYENDLVQVRFTTKTRSFLYPDAFLQGHLKKI